MTTMITFELDGHKRELSLREWNKACTRAEAAATKPLSPHYNGKSTRWNLRTVLREVIVGRGEPELADCQDSGSLFPE